MGAQGVFPHYFLNVWLRVPGRNGDFARFQVAGNRRIPSGAYVKNLQGNFEYFPDSGAGSQKT